MTFSEAAIGAFLLKNLFLNFFNIHRKVTGLQFYEKETPTQLLSSEYCKILRTPILKKIFEQLLVIFIIATQYGWAATSVLTLLLLSSDNLFTGCGIKLLTIQSKFVNMSFITKRLIHVTWIKYIQDLATYLLSKKLIHMK